MNKKILLIYPKFSEQLRIALPNLPMSLIYVGSYLVYKGYKVRIIDLNNIADMKKSLNIIKDELNDSIAVGISVMSAQVPNALEISKYIKQINQDMPIIWGGIHPTLYPEQTVMSKFIDFVVIGEGEITVHELIKTIEKNGSFEKIKGVSFKNKKNEVIVTDKREFLDINELPPIAWKLVEGIAPFKSLKEIAEFSGSGIPIQTSRGCPYRCAFCINKVLRTGYRMRNLDLVLRDIKTLLDMGVKSLSFIDDNFFTNSNRVLEFLSRIEKDNLKFKWFANIRADYFRGDYITETFAERLKKNGCEIVGIGAESGSQKILDYLKKDITVEQIKHSFNILINAGIQVSLSFIIGLPSVEMEEDIKSTLNLLYNFSKMDKNCLLRVGIQVYRPYPGSELYDICLSKGMKKSGKLEDWIDSPFIKTRIEKDSYEDYIWISYDIKRNLNNYIFYGSLMCYKSTNKLLNQLARTIARMRYQLFYIRMPIENFIYTKIIRRSGADIPLKAKTLST